MLRGTVWAIFGAGGGRFALDFADAVRLVRKRGEYMQSAVPAWSWGDGCACSSFRKGSLK